MATGWSTPLVRSCSGNVQEKFVVVGLGSRFATGIMACRRVGRPMRLAFCPLTSVPLDGPLLAASWQAEPYPTT